jgi:hypothetical protein
MFLSTGRDDLFSTRSTEDIYTFTRSDEQTSFLTDTALPPMGGAKRCFEIRSDTELKSVSISLVSGETEFSLSEHRIGAQALQFRLQSVAEILWKASKSLVVPERMERRER